MSTRVLPSLNFSFAWEDCSETELKTITQPCVKVVPVSSMQLTLNSSCVRFLNKCCGKCRQAKIKFFVPEFFNGYLCFWVKERYNYQRRNDTISFLRRPFFLSPSLKKGQVKYAQLLWLCVFLMVSAGSWTHTAVPNTHCMLNCAEL